MELAQAVRRFTFLAHALNATGGFAPVVEWSTDSETGKTTATLKGPSYLIRHTRESDEKFGGRNALATYENHLRSACERYVGFLGRRKPVRQGVDSPLAKLMVENADLLGNDLDAFWRAFALEARARGSMLLVLDKLDPDTPVHSLADQVRARAVPYVRAAEPERLVAFTLDAQTGLFATASLTDVYPVDGTPKTVIREYDAAGWRIMDGKREVKKGTHAFGACPVLPFTENGQAFPVVGKFAQVADLSLRYFNAASELDDILRGVTFPLLTLQVPPEHANTFNPAKTAATIGTHSMIVHSGNTPEFIAPPSDPADVYMKRMEALQASISRITYEDVTSASKGAAPAESGVSRKLRFEALNADLATFAKQVQGLEVRMWAMFNRATANGASSAKTTWPSDYNLADVSSELDVLAQMQDTGFPPDVLAEKRQTIAATEFDGADEATKARIRASINEAAQREAKQAEDPPDDEEPGTPPGNKPPAAPAA